jgi:hypothetical protein
MTFLAWSSTSWGKTGRCAGAYRHHFHSVGRVRPGPAAQPGAVPFIDLTSRVLLRVSRVCPNRIDYGQGNMVRCTWVLSLALFSFAVRTALHARPFAPHGPRCGRHRTGRQALRGRRSAPAFEAALAHPRPQACIKLHLPCANMTRIAEDMHRGASQPGFHRRETVCPGEDQRKRTSPLYPTAAACRILRGVPGGLTGHVEQGLCWSRAAEAAAGECLPARL